MRNRARYSSLLCGTAIAVVAMAAAPAFAEGKPINIEPQSLASALREFASQSQQAILVAPALADGKSSKGVHDATDPELALAQLLQGTGLTWRRSGEALLIVSASDPQSGSAAGDGADSGTVQALIVTAQKREEDIQDVPIAISAFTQEDLTRSQVAGGPDLMTQVPNFTFTKTNFSGYSIQIRGIGTQAISATVDPAVAVAFNNTPFIRNRFFEQEFYDLQRVEVLRGPQGTLYGRNATAGVVNIISAKPNFRYEAKLSGDVSNYKSTRFEGMLNIPLAEDKVALRLAGAWTKRDGYVTNQITGNPIDGRDLWSTRLSLRIEPTDRIKANLVWEHFQEDDDRLRSGKQLCKKDLKDNIAGVPIPPINDVILSAAAIYTQGCVAASLYADESFQTPNGFALPYFTPLSAIGLPVDPFTDPYLSTTQSHDLRVIESTLDPKYRAKSDLGEVQIGIDLTDNLTLTSETAYSTDFLFSTQDYNRFNTTPGVFRDSYGLEDSVRAGLVTNGIFCDPQLGCANRLVGEDLSTARSRQFSQEIRLSSDFEGAFNFSGGVNLLRYDTEDKYYVFFNTLTLFSAGVPFRVSSGLPAWEPGVSDSHECLRPGILPGDPLEPQRVDDCIYIDPNPIDHLNDMGHNYFLSKNPYKLISYAAFGEAYYQLMSNLKVTAGLRWTVDKKEAPQYPSWLLANQSAGYPVFEVIRQEWREPTGRITVDWKPDFGFTDETLIYGSYAHGYKAGGANPPPALIATALNNIGSANNIQNLLTHPRTFDPEFVDAFELGAKNTLADGRLTLNATVFYYDYTAYQISEIVDRSAINMNFDAKVWGAELEADWRPLENLRLGFKGGYENTRVADGMKAIDLMDRTAGDPNYVVARPFPTVPSNCILPVSWVTFGDRINVGDSLTGPCVLAYQDHVDPITGLPYVADPTVWLVGAEIKPLGSQWAGYPGFDPSTVPNNGEGIFKDLSGNALPNAPHFTATLTADYTVPLPHDWLMTLHTDLYYQSEAWTRIFNDSGYDKLKAYNNVNFAAIFSNEDAGWQIMAYVKNVFDKDNITGAFLNSDDTALTTNVFLNEPRLYGLRVTKNWTGGSVWGSGARHDPGLPYRFRVELGGSIQRQDAPYSTVAPSFADAFSTALSPLDAEHGDLDWGDGREVKLTYTPTGPWSISLGARYGKTNGDAKLTRTELAKGGCGLKYDFCLSNPGAYQQPTNYANTSVHAREEHTIADFMVGRDLGIGAAGFASKVSVGLQYARLKSETGLELAGIPNWYIPPEYWAAKYSTRDRYSASLVDKRTFEGAGPVVSWDGSRRLVDKADSGRVSVDWTATGGVLFGNRKNLVHGVERDEFYRVKYPDNLESPQVTTTPVHDAGPSKSATVPTVDLSLGLSYEVQGFKVGAGYRWERFFNAIGSDDQSKSYDRTIDGPYFKVSVGFGG